jgi:hypothetical protein
LDGQFSKALGAAPRNLLSKRRKGCELAGFENLFTNSIAFCAKRLRDLLVQNKIKGAIKKIMNICLTISQPRPIKSYFYNTIIISCPSPF